MTSRTRIAASLVVLAVIAPGGASAGGAWTKQTISNRNLAAVSFPTPQRGWAVGTGGSVVATTNGGATWSAQTSGTSSDLRGVDFVDAARGWVVGLSDTVLSTSNGGATWKASTTGTGLNLVAVDFVDATHGWAVGYTASLVQMIVSTKDGGTTWTSQQAPAGIGLLAISFADRLRGFTVGYLGAAYRTEDGGQTWLPMHVKADVGADLTSDSFYAVVRMSADEGLVAGFRGQVARTEDGGLTWQVTGTLPNPVRSLAASGDAAFAVGDGGLVAESTDAGKTWRLGASGTTLNLTGVSAPSPNRAFAVGAAGIGLAFVGEGAAATPLQMGLDPEICDGITKDWGTDAAGFVVPTITLDPTGNGDRAIVIGGTEGVRALRPFRPTAEATLWKLELQASFQRLAVAELDGDEGDELIAATAAPNAAARSGVTAVDGATGEALWSRRLPDGSRGVRTSDLDGDGIDDVVAWSEDKAIYTLSGTNGSDLRAPKPVGERVRDLRLGHLNGDGVRDIVAALHDGRVLALSGATGGPLWSHQVPRGELRGATLRDLSGDGIPEAIVAGAGESRSVTPGNGDSVTTVGNIRGALVAVLDGRDGTLIWDYRQPGTVNFNAVTTADLNGDGVHDVIGQVSRLDNSHVLALDGRGRSVNAVGTPEPLVLWTYSTARPGASPLQQASTPDALTVADGSGDGTPDVYAGLWSGGPFAVDGTPPAPDPDPAIRAPRAAGLWEVADRGIAYGVSVERFDGRLLILSSVSDGLVTLRDAGSGQVAWAYDAGIFPSIALGDLDGSPGRDVGVASVSGRLSAVDPAGRLRTPADAILPHRVRHVATLDVNGDGRDELIAGSDDRHVRAVDAVSGALRWEVEVPGRPTSLTVGGGTVVVGTHTGRLVALDPASGSTRWDLSLGSRVSASTFAGGTFAAGTEDGHVRFVRANGQETGMAETGTELLGGVYTIAAGDLDGAGPPEFVVGAGYVFLSFRPDGTRGWEFHPGHFAVEAVVTDLSADGTEDVVAVAYNGNASGLDGQTGNHLWTTRVGQPKDATAADIDGDGNEEIVIGSEDTLTTPRLRVLAGDGSVLARCDLRKYPLAMLGGDVDRDGRDEVLVAMEEGDLYRLG